MQYRKPVQPRPNRARPLWQRCIFAMATGWEHGFRQGGAGQLAALDNRWGSRGAFLTSAEAVNYGVGDLGRGLQNAGASLENVLFPNVLDRWHPTTSQLSIAVLVRPLVIPPTATAQGIVDKAASPISATDTEYTLNINGTDSVWRLGVKPASGAVQNVNSVTTLSLTRTDMVVATRRNDRQRMWVQGILEASIVPANAGIENMTAQTLGFWRYGTTIRAEVRLGMAAVWDRELTESEIRALAVDPYVMWR